MRSMRRLILLFFVVIIGLPIAIGGAALIKDATPPSYLEQVDLETYNIDETLYGDIDNFMFQFLVGDQSLAVNERTINEAIYASLEGFKTENTQYKISDSEIFYLDGFWTKFDNNQLTLYTLFRYHGVSTTLTLKIDVESNTEDIKIQLNTFKVGQLPIPKAAFTYLLENFAPDIENDYSYGEIDYQSLYVTVLKEYIQDEIESNLDNDIILFDSLELQNGQFIINCQLNPENQNAVAIQETINEFKEIIENDTLVNNVSSVLGDSEAEQAFNNDFSLFVETMKQKIDDPLNADLTDDDVELLNSLQQSFQNIDPTTQQEIINALEGSVDPEVISNMNGALQNLDIEGFDGISDLFLGSKIPQE